MNLETNVEGLTREEGRAVRREDASELCRCRSWSASLPFVQAGKGHAQLGTCRVAIEEDERPSVPGSMAERSIAVQDQTWNVCPAT